MLSFLNNTFLFGQFVFNLSPDLWLIAQQKILFLAQAFTILTLTEKYFCTSHNRKLIKLIIAVSTLHNKLFWYGIAILRPRESRVKFRLNDLEVETTSSPSDSNSSNTSNGILFLGAPTDSTMSSSSSRSSVGGEKCCDLPHLKDGTGQAAPCAFSPYRAYIEDVLKTQGLKRAIHYLDRLHLHLLSKAKLTLDKPVQSAKEPTELEVSCCRPEKSSIVPLSCSWRFKLNFLLCWNVIIQFW